MNWPHFDYLSVPSSAKSQSDTSTPVSSSADDEATTGFAHFPLETHGAAIACACRFPPSPPPTQVESMGDVLLSLQDLLSMPMVSWQHLP